MIENRKIEYLKPIKILYKSKNIINENALLENDYDQAAFIYDNMMTSNGRGYILLDFGRELCGGIRIIRNFKPHQKKDLKIRIRFGESVGECFSKSRSFQSCKDAIIEIPTLSDLTFGNTGFRFVRIDFINKKVYNIPQIYAVSYETKYKQLGSFKCDNELINKIFDTSAYTLRLCMQNYLWDGAKRDRLIWVGDMDPEVRALSYLYGDIPLVDETLEHAENEYKLPSWFGNIPLYNAWYLEIIYDYFMKSGNREFVNKRIDYINGVIKQIESCITNEGEFDYSLVDIKSRGYFVDWPTFNLKEESKEVYPIILLYIFRDVKKLFAELNLDSKNIDTLIEKLENKKDYKFSKKQFDCFNILNGKKNNFDILTDGKAKGMTCFMSYYVLSAVAKYDINLALEMMNEFYGSMLDLGATTFFEEHDIEWTANCAPITRLNDKNEHDYHRDFGIECYKGYRESLCHGWSVGPIHFLIDNVIGLKVLKPGFEEYEINPNLGNLKYVEAKIPTKNGILEIEIKNTNGSYDIKHFIRK